MSQSNFDLKKTSLDSLCLDVVVVRSCPSATWPKKISATEWNKPTNVVYDGSSGLFIFLCDKEFSILFFCIHVCLSLP
jgi:hypothetical protein